MQSSSFAVIFMACLGGGFLWVLVLGVTAYQRRKKYLMAAAEYAGYTANNFELFAQGRTPSPQELVDGIARQAGRLGQQAAFIAVQMRNVSDTADVSVLEESGDRFRELYGAYYGDCARNSHTHPVAEAVAWAQQAATDLQYPKDLSERLARWADSVSLWEKVAKNLTWYYKRRAA